MVMWAQRRSLQEFHEFLLARGSAVNPPANGMVKILQKACNEPTVLDCSDQWQSYDLNVVVLKSAAMMPGYGVPARAPSPFLASEYSEIAGSKHGNHTVVAIVATISSLVALSLLLAGFYCCKRCKTTKNTRSFHKTTASHSRQSSGTCTPGLQYWFQELRGVQCTNPLELTPWPFWGLQWDAPRMIYFRKSSAEYVPAAPAIRVVTTTEAQVFTYKQLQFATNNFSPANVVGNGGFGLVYRSVLPDGRVAAIKQLDRDGKQGEREFRVEVDLLSRLHSPYLLQLIGYCADQDHRLLVYEYMSNGNLQEHLYSDGSPGNPPLLDWGTRMKIALDGARGLEYLHEHVIPPVIHRDFKTSNILLDENFNAKVSDFGLAKLGSDKIYGQVSTRVLGTTGYVAPEYALTGHLTTKSDVYSFGVVLLELLTGRVPVDMKRPPGQGVLVSWVLFLSLPGCGAIVQLVIIHREALPWLTDRDKVSELVDPVLEGQYSQKELIQVAAIAAMCVQSEADYRPLMPDVVQSLIPLVKQSTGSRVTSSPNFRHHIVTIKSSSIDSGSSGTSLNSPRIS
eukprot:Gb_12951 [translate_table: standard]